MQINNYVFKRYMKMSKSFNVISNLILGLIIPIFCVFLFGLTIFGLYKLVTNDKYSSIEVVSGTIFIPYFTWIGIKESVHIIQTPTDLRSFENECQSKLKKFGYERLERHKECRLLRREIQRGEISFSDKDEIFTSYERSGIK